MTQPIVRRSQRLRCGPLIGVAILFSASVASAETPSADRIAPFFMQAAAKSKPVGDGGFLRTWLLLEPISKPNRSNTVFTASYVRQTLNETYFPGQFTATPRDGQIVHSTVPLRWHALESNSFDVKLFNLAQALGKPAYGVIFWTYAVVVSPREIRDVRMAVGSNSASIWWLNGKETVGLFNDRRMVMDDVVSDRVTLRKGRNVIRGAVINGPGLSQFCARFLDAEGRPISDLTTVVR